MLVRLLYASRAPNQIDANVLEAILAQSRRNNSQQGITGLLCYSSNIFMQVLEGGRREVSSLYSRIAKDSRHSDVEILLFEEITERRFSNWTMGQVNLAKVNPATLLRYSHRSELNPFGVSGRASMSLLEELINTAAIVAKG